MPRIGQFLPRALIAGPIAFLTVALQLASAQDVRAPDTPETLARLLDAAYLTDEERAELRVFHGRWTEQDLTDPSLAARAAMIAGAWDHPALANPQVELMLRAEAAAHRGDLEDALQLLDGVDGLRAARMQAETLEALGRFDEAIAAAASAIAQRGNRNLSAAEITDVARAMAAHIRLAGPAPDQGATYQQMLSLLTDAHQRRDRLYWPAMVVEAELLYSRDNTPEAQAAAQQALALNPRAARAWQLLGRIAVAHFDFDNAEQIATRLRAIGSELDFSESETTSAAADLIQARARLRQRDPQGAIEWITSAMTRYPAHREAMALHAAAVAATFDYEQANALLATLDEHSPGVAIGYLEVGSALSEARQYAVAADYLEEATRRQPKLPEPWIELGLLETQSGRDDRALTALKHAEQLDPFNTRAKNSLRLIRELLQYKTIESDHFIVRFREGLDRLLAEEMIPVLERIHLRVAGPDGIDHEPSQKTVIELMPDHAWFAVRITGMPGVHTIAAATGPVIAMESPREGAGSSIGVYDWPRVLQHEYVHTVTLSRTDNRIPHWFTEAAAVYLEDGPWDERRADLLASKLRADELFDLEAINLAFVRPRTPTDRSQAYAQGAWMYEYMVERWGPQAPLALMDLYAAGASQATAMPQALGLTPEEFLSDFRRWATEQAQGWGLLLPEGAPSLAELLRTGRHEDEDSDVSIERLDELLEQYPNHPHLAETRARAALRMADGHVTEQTVPLIERWAQLKPIDSSPRRALARYYRQTDSPERAIPHLEYLDAREQYSPALAADLSRLYARTRDFERSREKAERATRIAPFDPSYRELAATAALRLSDLATAERHLLALTRIEPDREAHIRRLERLRAMINESR